MTVVLVAVIGALSAAIAAYGVYRSARWSNHAGGGHPEMSVEND